MAHKWTPRTKRQWVTRTPQIRISAEMLSCLALVEMPYGTGRTSALQDLVDKYGEELLSRTLAKLERLRLVEWRSGRLEWEHTFGLRLTYAGQLALARALSQRIDVQAVS